MRTDMSDEADDAIRFRQSPGLVLNRIGNGVADGVRDMCDPPR